MLSVMPSEEINKQRSAVTKQSYLFNDFLN